MRHPRRSRTNALLVLIAIGALARPPLAPAACAPSAALDAPTTLVLSGGGAKGAWEAGVAATLVRGGLAPRLVAGSPAGGLDAAMLPGGGPGPLEAVGRLLSRGQAHTLR